MRRAASAGEVGSLPRPIIQPAAAIGTFEIAMCGRVSQTAPSIRSQIRGRTCTSEGAAFEEFVIVTAYPIPDV
jgi:hypothetical protein